MPTVHLPMGYPVQTGQQFDLIVYQGNLVRSYTLPKDPRSDSALFQRRFLSDASKMRSYLGAWGRAALLEALGRTWSTVLFQLIKSDSFSWWSDAKTEWSNFDENYQQAWRDVAPYQVTYNDQGEMFYCLARVMVKAIRHYTLPTWKTAEWGAGESAAALEWYAADYEWALVEPGASHMDLRIQLFGTWVNSFWHWNGTQAQIESSGSENDWVEAYIYSKNVYAGVRSDPESTMVQVYISGELTAEGSMSTINATIPGLLFETTKKRLRSVLIRGKNGSKVAFTGVYA